MSAGTMPAATATHSRHVVFDVVGTCVSFDAFYHRIDEVIGVRLLECNINAAHFGYTWMTAAELEFTFLSISEHNQRYKDVLRALFYRTLGMIGIRDPRGFATDDERDTCVDAYSQLDLRDGCRECLQMLRDRGFTVWCLTTGDVDRVKGYFDRAEIDMPRENIISCDTKGMAKPSLAVYRSVLDKLQKGESPYFAGAHLWDVSAAVRAGFKGAYCLAYESDIVTGRYGAEMTVVAETLPKLA